MDKEDFRLAPWTGYQHQNKKTGRETKKKDGKMISTNFLIQRKHRKEQNTTS